MRSSVTNEKWVDNYTIRWFRQTNGRNVWMMDASFDGTGAAEQMVSTIEEEQQRYGDSLKVWRRPMADGKVWFHLYLKD